MNRQTTEATVRDILTTLIKRDPPPDENILRSQEQSWDSLQHMEMVFMLESRFGIRFDAEEVPKLDSSEAIVRLVEAKREA